MAKSLSLDSAPRNERELLLLTKQQRCRLFNQLCKLAETDIPPGRLAFKGMSDVEQVELLLPLLADFDQLAFGHIVIHVTLPIRSSSHVMNEKRMEVFARKLESTLQDLQDSGATSIQLVKFEDHGILVSGYRPEPVKVDIGMSFLPNVPTPRSPRGGGVATSVDPHTSVLATKCLVRLMGELEAQVQLQGSITEKDIEKLVDSRLNGMPSEVLGVMIGGLQHQIDVHIAGHQNENTPCQATEDLRVLRKVIEDRRRKQLS